MLFPKIIWTLKSIYSVPCRNFVSAVLHGWLMLTNCILMLELQQQRDHVQPSDVTDHHIMTSWLLHSSRNHPIYTPGRVQRPSSAHQHHHVNGGVFNRWKEGPFGSGGQPPSGKKGGVLLASVSLGNTPCVVESKIYPCIDFFQWKIGWFQVKMIDWKWN